MNKTAYAFGGVGGTAEALLTELHQNSPAARKFLDTAEEMLNQGRDSAQPAVMLWPRPGTRVVNGLERPSLSFPLRYVCNMTTMVALKEMVPSPSCAAMVGLSLGQLAAGAASDMISVETGLKLARRCGELLEQNAGNVSGNVVAVGVGLDDAKRLAEASGVPISNYLGPQQHAFAGTHDELQRLRDEAAKFREAAQLPATDRLSWKVTDLRTGFPLHSRHARSISEGLADVLQPSDIKEPSTLVINSIDGQPILSGAKARHALSHWVSEEMQWARSIDNLANEMRVDRFVVFEHSTGLTRIVRQIAPQAEIITLSGLADIQKNADALGESYSFGGGLRRRFGAVVGDERHRHVAARQQTHEIGLLLP